MFHGMLSASTRNDTHCQKFTCVLVGESKLAMRGGEKLLTIRLSGKTGFGGFGGAWGVVGLLKATPNTRNILNDR